MNYFKWDGNGKIAFELGTKSLEAKVQKKLDEYLLPK